MKKNLLILITPLLLFSQSYMAKIQPYDEFTIYSQSSGQIVSLDKKDETKTVSKMLIKLDDNLEKQKLAIYEKQVKLYKEKLALMEENYSKFVKIRGKSKSDKDDKYYEIIDLKVSIQSLNVTIDELRDTIRKKSIRVKDLYIKEFLVNKNDYVSTGTKLATAYDMSKAKLEVYVSSDDYENIGEKQVLINGQKNLAKIEKIDKTLDETFVSAHKITLQINNSNYGELVKVEFIK